MELSLFSAFLIGLAGSVHCFAMCGGIVAGLQLAIPKSVPVLPYMVAYNCGRLLSYTIAGLLAGTLGAIFTLHVSSGLIILKLISGLFLIALAAYIGQWWSGLTYLESAGKHLWRLISPIGKQFLPFRSALSAFPYGIIWGWLPCGLVYSTLTWSLSSGTALQGALIMLFFGLGTLPAIVLTAIGSKSLNHAFRRPQTRQAIAVILLLVGIYTAFESLRAIVI